MILRRLFGRSKGDEHQAVEGPDPVGQVGRQDAEADSGPSFYTSTATMVIYDLASLKHRLDDDVDWWADPVVEIEEINRRNVLIVGLTFDDFYDLEITECENLRRSYSLSFPSGQIFVGPGEVMTGGGDEPDGSCQGHFLTLDPGDYKVSVKREDNRLIVGLTPHAAFENAVEQPIIL